MYDETMQSAYHEAGHVVAAYELGLAVLGAPVRPDAVPGKVSHTFVPVEDRVRYADWADEPGYLYAHMVAAYAGIVAGDRYVGALQPEVPSTEPEPAPAYSDVGTIAQLLVEVAGEDEAAQIEEGERARRHARMIVDARWDHVALIAEALADRETLDAAEIRELLALP